MSVPFRENPTGRLTLLVDVDAQTPRTCVKIPKLKDVSFVTGTDLCICYKSIDSGLPDEPFWDPNTSCVVI